MAVSDSHTRDREFVLEEVRRPWWLAFMIGLATALGYGLRGLGWLIEHIGGAVRQAGREMVLALQRLDYPETQKLTDEEKRVLLEKEKRGLKEGRR